MFLILLGTLIFGLFLIAYYKLKSPDKGFLLFIGVFLSIGALFFIPFFDPLKIDGFLAYVMTQNTYPSIFAIIGGLTVINCAVYGIHLFLSAMKLIRAEEFKNPLVQTGSFAKRRHPIYASYQIIGLSFQVLMGSVSGVLILSIIIVLLYLEACRVEYRILLPKYRDAYLEYKKKVVKRLYSKDVSSILIIIYAIFFVGLFGVMFFSEL